MNKKISETVNSWIIEEDLPSRADLQVVRTAARYFDPCRDMDDDECEAYREFIVRSLSQEHTLLLTIPKAKDEGDFWKVDLDEFGDDISAFNTHDYQRVYTLNRYHYKLKKIYEKVKDLALFHSCISQRQGKENIKQRYVNLIEKEFRDRAVFLLETYRKYSIWMNRDKLIDEIAKLNCNIRKCNHIWQEYALSDEPR